MRLLLDTPSNSVGLTISEALPGVYGGVMWRRVLDLKWIAEWVQFPMHNTTINRHYANYISEKFHAYLTYNLNTARSVNFHVYSNTYTKLP